jgi:hypothetical protein
VILGTAAVRDPHFVREAARDSKMEAVTRPSSAKTREKPSGSAFF